PLCDPLSPYTTLFRSQLDVADILTLDQHVRLADGEGFRIQLLAMQRHRDLLADLLDVLVPFREEAAGSGCRVIDGDDAVRLEFEIGRAHLNSSHVKIS